MRRIRASFVVLLAVLAGLNYAEEQKTAFEFKPGERVVFIGNTFAERLIKGGYFESTLTARLPEHKLIFRNMGWSADTLTIQMRPLNFGDLHTHLHEQKPNVIIACYGMMESFDGPEGLSKFESDLNSFLKLHQGMDYSGAGNPRLILVSPIAHEKLEGDFPDPAPHNQNLKLYTESMRKIAAALNLPFVDLYNPTLALMADPSAPKLTINGIHLNEYGNWVVAQMMLEQLGYAATQRIEIDAAQGTVSAAGMKAGAVQKSPERVTFTLTADVLPVPPPPSEVRIPAAAAKYESTIVIKGLSPGAYQLTIDGQKTALADAAAWGKGIPVAAGPGSASADQLRQLVDDKNWHFFMRYRPLNGEYVYGRRKDPFGTKSFPPEWVILDKMIADQEAKILLATKAPAQTVELIRAKE